MKKISIGIYVDGELERLRWTLASLNANAPHDVELLLLLDGVVLNETTNRVKLSGTSDARGTAACFNRLVSLTDADILVLLESGVQVAPGWLDRLLAALDADPRNGLAGPSTNNAWNEQGAFPRCSGNTAQIIATANDAAKRFGKHRLRESVGAFCCSLDTPFDPVGELEKHLYAANDLVLFFQRRQDERQLTYSLAI